MEQTLLPVIPFPYETKEENALALSLDSHLDGVNEVQMALEHLCRQRAHILSQEDISDFSLKMFRTSLENWQRYLKSPKKPVAALEAYENMTNKQIALEEEKGFFATLAEAIRNTFKWIVDAITNLFKSDADKASPGTDAFEKAPEAVATAIEEKAKKAKEDKKPLAFNNLQVFGVTDTRGVSLKAVAEHLKDVWALTRLVGSMVTDTTATSTMVLKQIDLLVNSKETTSTEDIKKAMSERLKNIEGILSPFKSTNAQMDKSLGTDPGSVYAIPLVKDASYVLIKVAKEPALKFDSKFYQEKPESYVNHIDPDTMTHTNNIALGNICVETKDQIEKFGKTLETFLADMKAAQKRSDAMLGRLTASAHEQHREFITLLKSSITLLLSMARALITIKKSVTGMFKVCDKIMAVPAGK